MSSVARAVVGASMLFAGLVTSSPASAAPGADVYGALPDTTQAIVSPDATQVAFIQPGRDGAEAVAVYKLDSDAAPCVVAPTKVKIRDVVWAGPARLILTFSFTNTVHEESSSHRMREWSRALVMNADCTNGKPLLRDAETGPYFQTNAAGILHVAADGSSALMESYSFNGIDQQPMGGSHFQTKQQGLTFDVYRVDLATGKSSPVETGSTDTVGWLTDSSGEVRLRIDYALSRYEFYARLSGSKDWVHVYGYGDADRAQKQITPVGFGSDPDMLLVLMSAGHDRRVAAKFDLRTKALAGTMFEQPTVDVAAYADDASGRLVGAVYTLDHQQVSYFDPAWAHVQATLQASFGGDTVYITSATPDAKTVVALVEGPDNPSGSYYIIDMAKGAASKIGERYGHVAPADYAPVKAITYKARDGLQIPAYLTLPPGATGKNLPLVVFPHGGPAYRDTADFDWWAQFLATRGYAVLQPNFRGSTGYGTSFELAGHRQWGLAMQNDLSDGVKYLIDQGTVDAKRVCIVGASYGGYAALAGMTLTPDLYKCGVADAGVSDLPKFLGYLRQQGHTDFGPNDYSLENIGSPFTDGERLNATSPAQHAAAMTGSLLLIHGQSDTVVPIVQSELMAAALDKAGKHYEFVRLEGEDHWLSSAKTRTEMLKAIEAFLAKNLKGP